MTKTEDWNALGKNRPPSTIFKIIMVLNLIAYSWGVLFLAVYGIKFLMGY